MKRIATFSAVVTLAAVAVIGPHSPATGGDVSIGIQIGTPPPPRPVVVIAPQPPPVVVAPEPVLVIESGSPVYFHAGWYYRFYNGAWFIAEVYEGPWMFMPAHRVPRRVQALPTAYSRMHPSNVVVVGPHPWHEEEHEHGHGHGHGGRH